MSGLAHDPETVAMPTGERKRLQRDVGRLRVSFGSRASRFTDGLDMKEGKRRVEVRDELGLGLSYWTKGGGKIWERAIGRGSQSSVHTLS